MRCTVPLAVASEIGEASGENIALFDGTCGFCAWSLRRLVFSLGPMRLDCIPYQWVSPALFRELGTTAEQCAQALHVWNRCERRLYRGADAFNRIASDTPRGRRIVAVVNAIKPLLALERLLYAIIADNRSRISAVLRTRGCAVIRDQADAPATSGK